MQWKLKAQELLKNLVDIWYGEKAPEGLFANGGFEFAFRRVIEAYLQDCGHSAPRAELDIYLTRRRLTYRARHGVDLVFASQAKEAEWIAEAVAIELWRDDLLRDNIVEAVLRLAHAIEDILRQCHALPADYLQSVEQVIGMPLPSLDPLPTQATQDEASSATADTLDQIERFENGW